MGAISIRNTARVQPDTKKSSERVQMVVRLPESLMQRIKYQAHKAEMSVNAYVEEKMEEATRVALPKLPKEYKVDISGFPEKVKLKRPSSAELESDPKLAYLWDKHNMEERVNEG